MDRNPLILSGIVVAAHLILLFINFNIPSPVPPNKKSIYVRTLSLSSSTEAQRPSFSTSTQPSKPLKIGPNTSFSTKKNPKIENHPSHRKGVQEKRAILKTAEHSLKKMAAMTPFEPKKGAFPLPLNPPRLEIDQNDSIETDGYLTFLIHSLKEALELPERGNVTLSLTIQNSGKVLKLKVLESASDCNRAYLERALLTTALPPFSQDLKSANEQTWVLTFCNEM